MSNLNYCVNIETETGSKTVSLNNHLSNSFKDNYNKLSMSSQMSIMESMQEDLQHHYDVTGEVDASKIAYEYTLMEINK